MSRVDRIVRRMKELWEQFLLLSLRRAIHGANEPLLLNDDDNAAYEGTMTALHGRASLRTEDRTMIIPRFPISDRRIVYLYLNDIYISNHYEIIPPNNFSCNDSVFIVAFMYILYVIINKDFISLCLIYLNKFLFPFLKRFRMHSIVYIMVSPFPKVNNAFYLLHYGFSILKVNNACYL